MTDTGPLLEECAARLRPFERARVGRAGCGVSLAAMASMTVLVYAGLWQVGERWGAGFRTVVVSGLASAVLMVVGFCGIFVMAGANTSHQLTVPDDLRGRIMSLHMMVFAGMSPFGAFLVGALAERFGIRATLAVAGIAGMVSIAALAAWWRLRRRPK